MKRIAFAALASLAMIAGAHAETVGVLDHPLFNKDIGLMLRLQGLPCTEVKRDLMVKRDYDQGDPTLTNHVYCDSTPLGQWYKVTVNMMTFDISTEAIDPPEQNFSVLSLLLK